MAVGLNKLFDYCRNYFSGEVDPRSILREFWEIENDDLFFDVLGFMPLFVPQIHFDDLSVPEGFRIAWPIFILEDDYHINGWTAFRNWRPILPEIAEAYERAGLADEGLALRAAAAAHDEGLEDAEIGDAYLAVPSPYHDDDVRLDALRRFFCANRSLFRATEPRP